MYEAEYSHSCTFKLIPPYLCLYSNLKGGRFLLTDVSDNNNTQKDYNDEFPTDTYGLMYIRRYASL